MVLFEKQCSKNVNCITHCIYWANSSNIEHLYQKKC